MATVTIPYSNFVNGTAADGDQVDANFEALRTFVQSSVPHIDGTNAFSGYPTLPNTSPTNARHPAPKTYVDAADATRLKIANSGQTIALVGSSTVTTDGSGNATVTFATSFPTSCLCVLVSPTTAIAVGGASWSTSGFTVKGPASTTFTVAWAAFGQ